MSDLDASVCIGCVLFICMCMCVGREEVVLCPCMTYVFCDLCDLPPCVLVVTYHNRFSVCVGAQNTFGACLYTDSSLYRVYAVGGAKSTCTVKSSTAGLHGMYFSET